MATLTTLHELLVHDLEDLYSAEKQLIKALPKMAEASSSGQLRSGFEEHLRQTEEHVTRLDNILAALDVGNSGSRCVAMEGIIEESSNILNEEADPSIRDAGLIAAAQKVEHYEIAGYGTVSTYATRLGLDDAAELLRQTLAEEKETDRKLTEMAEADINAEAQADPGRSPQRTRHQARSTKRRRARPIVAGKRP